MSMTTTGYQNISNLFHHHPVTTIADVVNAVVAEPVRTEVTYGAWHKELCESIAVVDIDTTVDLNDDLLSSGGVLDLFNLSGKRYSGVTARGIRIKDCDELILSNVKVDFIVVSNVRRLLLNNVQARCIITQRVCDIAIFDFRIDSMFVHATHTELGDGTSRKAVIIADNLFLSGVLDRMAEWDFVSPQLSVGPDVPLGTSSRQRTYAQADNTGENIVALSHKKWLDSVGVFNPRTYMLAMHDVFGCGTDTSDAEASDAMLANKGMCVLHGMLTMLGGVGGMFDMPIGRTAVEMYSLSQVAIEERKRLIEQYPDQDMSILSLLADPKNKRITVIQAPVPPSIKMEINGVPTENNTATATHTPFSSGITIQPLSEEDEQLRQQQATQQDRGKRK